MQLKPDDTIPEEVTSVNDTPALSPIQEELLVLSQFGVKLRSKIYKNLLKLLVFKVEVSHLVVLIVSLGLFYRGLSFIDHVSSMKDLHFSVISEASAEAATSKEEPKNEKKAEPIKTEAKEASKGELVKDEMDPLLLDENQIKVLLALAKKEKNIKETEHDADVEKQKKIAELAQENLDKRIEELEKVKKGLEAKKDELTKDEKQNVTNMAKIYETMKPAQAADILNKLELTSVTQIIKNMNQKKAAAIVASMEPTKARQLTLEILKSKDVEGKNSQPAISEKAPAPSPAIAPAPSPMAATSTAAAAPDHKLPVEAAPAVAPASEVKSPVEAVPVAAPVPEPKSPAGAAPAVVPAPDHKSPAEVVPVAAPVPEPKSPAGAAPAVVPSSEVKSPTEGTSKESPPPVSKT